MNWADFIAAVRVDLPVDNERIGIATGDNNYLDRQILHAVVEIQKFVPLYQVGHETVYGPDDLVLQGLASVGSFPVTNECHPLDAYYKKTGTQCVSQPMQPYDWGNRFDLVCGNPRIANCQFFIAIDPTGKQFMTFPLIGQEHQLSLFWSGVKTEFEDADETPFTSAVAEAVALFVKSRIARVVDHDLQEASSYLAEYKLKKALLYVDAQERTRMKLTGSSQQTGFCANTVSILESDGTVVVDPNIPSEDTVEFAAFGDSGDPDTIANTMAVSELVRALDPDFVMHLGDCVYPDGNPTLIDGDLIKPYGLYIPASFLLAFGNHDIETDSGTALDALLTKQAALNNGKRYYEFLPSDVGSTADLVALFVLDTNGDPVEQAAWLQPALEASDLWNIVVLHKAPYTSDLAHYPGDASWRFDFKTWGADLVISGHGHNYERLLEDGLPYLVCGLGGAPKRGFVDTPVDGSQFRYYERYGSLWITAREERLQTVFYDTRGEEIDSFSLQTDLAAV